ncbi:Molybdopterin molybdenumtransferase [Mannheimia haemolytica]|uniref:Molybdopterin molybdenumtransferase n=1 Tax=Mannheimia haemolytica TaxID=75985 RepID=A0A378N7D8_MANHA|nr:Molybdopterin molybdenumtransferase [Mannheimia haemolytica]
MALLALSDALDNMLARLSTPKLVEQLPLNECANRVLAEDIFSPINVPNFDNSAMDGYAVRISDLAQNLTLNVAGKAFAGNPFNGEIKAGECVRIMTGALVPKGVDAVVMQEETTLNSDGSVTFNHIPKLGSNIRRIGKMLNRGHWS